MPRRIKFAHKEIGWSFPGSSNATRFGHAAKGCYTLEFLRATTKIPVAQSGHATKEEAILAGLQSPLPWSRHFQDTDAATLEKAIDNETARRAAAVPGASDFGILTAAVVDGEFVCITNHSITNELQTALENA